MVLLASMLAVMVAGFGASPASAAGPALGTGQTLASGDRMTSPDGRFALVMQGDGNLVLYGPSGVGWSSRTNGQNGAYLVMQGDGNLVMYRNGAAIFATGTRGNNAVLELQNDGNAVVYKEGHQATWASASKAEAAISWFYGRMGNTSYEGRCELAVENAFGTSGRYPTAIANWNARAKQYPYTAAPRGALVFYNTSSAAHVAISLGNGQVVSTSVNGRIGIAGIGYFQNPLGWASSPWG